MPKLFLTFLILSSITVAAESQCPQLQGTFHCRSAAPFDLEIKESLVDGVKTYVLTDPTGTRTVTADGQVHEMKFREGAKGQYRAHCEGNALILEAQSPAGEVLVDRYYIERAGLVRVRINQTKQAASSLSCAPTQGTWRLYQR